MHGGCYRADGCVRSNGLQSLYLDQQLISAAAQLALTTSQRTETAVRGCCLESTVCCGGRGGGEGVDVYLTPRGKFEMVQYRLKQHTPLHLAETGASS